MRAIIRRGNGTIKPSLRTREGLPSMNEWRVPRTGIGGIRSDQAMERKVKDKKSRRKHNQFQGFSGLFWNSTVDVIFPFYWPRCSWQVES